MSYSTMALMANDRRFIARVTACVATQGIRDAEKWTTDNRWAVSAAPGFDDAYAYAVANGNAEPGEDPAVISDTDILAAVQLLLSGR